MGLMNVGRQYIQRLVGSSSCFELSTEQPTDLTVQVFKKRQQTDFFFSQRQLAPLVITRRYHRPSGQFPLTRWSYQQHGKNSSSSKFPFVAASVLVASAILFSKREETEVSSRVVWAETKPQTDLRRVISDANKVSVEQLIRVIEHTVWLAMRHPEQEEHRVLAWAFMRVAMGKEEAFQSVPNLSLRHLKSDLLDMVTCCRREEHPQPQRLAEFLTGREKYWKACTKQPTDKGYWKSVGEGPVADFVIKLLKGTPFSEWENKGKVLLQLEEVCNDETWAKVCNELRNAACDKETKELGELLYSLYKSENIFEGVAAMRRIQQLLPGLDCRQAFGRRFGYDFQSMQPMKNSLSFHYCSKVFVHGSLLIGLQYQRYSRIQGSCVISGPRAVEHPSWALAAYDLKSGEAVWCRSLGLDANSGSWVLQREKMCTLLAIKEINQGLAWVDKGDKTLRFLNPKTGEISSEVTLPYAPKEIHFCPSGFTYFVAGQGGKAWVFGGKVEDGKWVESFKMPRPKGDFKELGEFLAFTTDYDREAFVIDSEGKQSYLSNVTELRVHDGHLYSIQDDGKTAPRLVRQYLHADQTLSLAKAELLYVGDKGANRSLSLLGFSEKGVAVLRTTAVGCDYRLLFVDVAKKELLKTEKQIGWGASVWVDERTGTVIYRHEGSRKIYRVGLEKTEELRDLEIYNRGGSLLYVMDDGCPLFST